MLSLRMLWVFSKLKSVTVSDGPGQPPRTYHLPPGVYPLRYKIALLKRRLRRESKARLRAEEAHAQETDEARKRIGDLEYAYEAVKAEHLCRECRARIADDY